MYLDFRKAFDCVPHTQLLIKLQAYGICSDLYNWLCDCLTERKQKVVLNGESSSWTPVTSGVPQSLVLGPLLFNLFVNNLLSIIVLFADNAKIYHSIQSDSDYLQLQQDLDNLFKWSHDWQLCFNVTKCKVLHIGSNQHFREYRLGRDIIAPSNVERDLGILVDNKLKFHEQCSAVIAKANKLLGMIRRSFECTDMNMILCLYKH